MSVPSTATVREAISRELTQVQEVSYGETDCRVEVSLNDASVTVIMDLHLSPSEEALIGSGNADSVKFGRDAFQLAIAATSAAVVERATGRRVTSFASRAVIDDGPAWTTDVFRLGKAPAGL